MILVSRCVICLLVLIFARASIAADYRTIEWIDLLPDQDFQALSNPPDLLSRIEDGGDQDILLEGLSGSITDAIAQSNNDISESDQAYYDALASVNVREEFDQVTVRIPGFLVPIDFDDDLKITTLFLVPYFGACIHLPPPPPNQIIYIHYPEGIELDNLYEPFWVEGTLSTSLIENEIAVSAYSIDADAISPYEI